MMYMDFKRKLPIPMETKEMYPLTGDMAETVERTVTELKAIFSGDSEKLALIIGPCSADNEESVIDYISRLMPLREPAEKPAADGRVPPGCQADCVPWGRAGFCEKAPERRAA
jgi:phospho-2-dehydro-3-deoxyheptonate aldolase